MSDETSIQKPEAEAVAESKANIDDDAAIQPAADEKKTPKRTPKRRSFIERAQRESEELVRTMGGSLELEGGRRTRSSTRGTPTRAAEAVTPPPTKKARTSPATTKSGGRARGARKLDVGGDEDTEPVKSKPAEKEAQSPAPEPVKANIAVKKDKKGGKAEKPKEVVLKNKADDKSSESSETKDTQSEESPPKVVESKDQADSAEKVAAEKEETQNNVDHDKESTKASEEQEKSPEKAKSEERAKIEEPTTNAAESAPVSAMEVDEEEKQQPSTEQPDADTTSSNTSVPAVVPETVEEKKDSKESEEKDSIDEPNTEAEPAKQQTPEPMEVDASSKVSSETADPISPVKDDAPVAEVVESEASSASAPTSAPAPAETATSNNEAVELATEVKEDAPVVTEKEASASEVESTTTENNATVVDDASVNANNDVSKQVPIVTVDAAVTEPPTEPIKEPQANCENKSEHNDNGEPKIVNNAAEDGENHVTPQACN